MQDLGEQNAVLTSSAQASLQAQLASVAATINSLRENRQNEMQEVAFLSDQLKLMDSKEAVIARQERSLSTQIEKIMPMATKGKIRAGKNATALTMVIQDNQVTQEQMQLYRLQMETAVELPKERLRMVKQIHTWRNKAASITTQITAQKAKENSLQDALKAVIPTQIIRTASPSLDPVGPSRAVIVVFGFFLGLLAGVFLALVLHATRKGLTANVPVVEDKTPSSGTE